MSETEELDKGPFKAGRPMKYTDPIALHQAIEAYFSLCDPHIVDRMVESGIGQDGKTIFAERKVMTTQRPYTTTGLARALKTTRQTLLDYQNPDHYSADIPDDVRQEIIDTICEAKVRVEEFAEGSLYTPFSAGAKFTLINNHDGWKEKIVQEHEGGFFDRPQRVEVEIVNPEPSADESTQTEAQPDPESGATPTP